MDMMEALSAVSRDVNATLKRFSGNQALLRRFVEKFPQDETYKQLEAAVKAGDYDGIEKEAHTLKGVAGNLGFTELFEDSGALVQSIRSGNTDNVAELFDAVRASYDKVIKTIATID